MDPNATLAALCEALDNCEETADELADNLLNWLDNGGFEPDWSAHKTTFLGVCTKEWFYEIAR